MGHLRLTRDALLFILGATGFLHELFFPGPMERPYLLTASVALMGGAVTLRALELLKK